jgi:hypothetical protein
MQDRPARGVAVPAMASRGALAVVLYWRPGPGLALFRASGARPLGAGVALYLPTGFWLAADYTEQDKGISMLAICGTVRLSPRQWASAIGRRKVS